MAMERAFKLKQIITSHFVAKCSSKTKTLRVLAQNTLKCYNNISYTSFSQHR